MNVLVINGYCLSVNSSANLCHLAYLQGLVDADAHVSLLSIDPADYPADLSMKIPDKIDCQYIRAISLYERLSHFKKVCSAQMSSIRKERLLRLVDSQMACFRA